MRGALAGEFDLRGDRLAGSVSIPNDAAVEIQVQRHGRTIAACLATMEPNEDLCTFALPIEGRFAPRELIDESVTVSARNTLGDTGVLKLEGATQLELIREYMGVPAVPIFDLDFTEGGNAEPYLGEGWSGTEEDFTWAEDDESVINVDAPSEPGTYALRITCCPLIHPPDLLSQEMQVRINGAHVGTVVATDALMQFREIKVDSTLFAGASRMTLQFRHSDAARPSEFTDSDDMRRLAFCFRRVSLVRLLPPTAK